MFGPKMGTWWVSSKQDPRWDKSDRGEGLVTAGGPPEMQDWLNQCKESFGESPSDLEVGFMKD